MKIVVTLALLAVTAFPSLGQQAIANKPPKVFGPVKTIRYEYFSYNFNRGKTRIEEVFPDGRTVVYTFRPARKLISYDEFETDGRFSGTYGVYYYTGGKLTKSHHRLLGSSSFQEDFSYLDGGRRKKATRVFVTNEPPLVEIDEYDGKGNIKRALFYDVDGILKETETYKYDGKRNPVEFASYDREGKLVFKETYEYEFDSYGNWTTQRDRRWSANPELGETRKTTITRRISYH
jgi:hypothetical protein